MREKEEEEEEGKEKMRKRKRVKKKEKKRTGVEGDCGLKRGAQTYLPPVLQSAANDHLRPASEWRLAP